MSRLNDLLRELKQREPTLARDLESEVSALANRRAFGLNFERHVPEAVELPGRKVRKGDKVRILPPRGQRSKKSDERLWRVIGIDRTSNAAQLEKLAAQRTASDSVHQLQKIESNEAAIDDLVVVAEFRDPIYPGLVSTGRVERGGDKPFHTVINAENYHALETLLFTHKGKVDCIYIDPPYNSGAKDWKYNNNYVEKDDLYRHSKWLAFMERRLLLAKELLQPENSVLIATIDEKEYLRLGLLLEQIFPEANIQMISSVINPKGTGRLNEFSRTDEYIFFVLFGNVHIPNIGGNGKETEVRWRYLRRTDIESARGTKKGGPAQFYPIYVDNKSKTIKKIGEPLPHTANRDSAPELKDCTMVFPIREDDGMEMNWGLTAPSLQKAFDKGFVRISENEGSELQPFIFSYLTAPNIKKLEEGKFIKTGKREDGSWIVLNPEGKSSRPTTNWNFKSHEAGAHGTSLLRTLLPGRKFPFPKSLYAVEDTLKFFLSPKPNAITLDFFAGSGTTAHAIMRLNKQDNGCRQCISITNNEVGVDEQKTLLSQNFRPGDAAWEKLGICEYITKPRIKAAILGETPEGKKLNGDYKFSDEFEMSDGFKENVEFFTLTYEAPLRVASNREFKKIAPLLWLRAGAKGRRIEDIECGWHLADTYGVLTSFDDTESFLKEIKKSKQVKIAFLVTDEDRLFETVSRMLPEAVEPVRLYESYLRNFEIESGRGSL